jgi:hypothetical protein
VRPDGPAKRGQSGAREAEGVDEVVGRWPPQLLGNGILFGERGCVLDECCDRLPQPSLDVAGPQERQAPVVECLALVIAAAVGLRVKQDLIRLAEKRRRSLMLAGLEPLPRRRLPRAILPRQAGPEVFLDEVHRDRMLPVETSP